MKLSQAIALGSTLLTAQVGIISADNGKGCAFGMAAKAAGIPIVDAIYANGTYSCPPDYCSNYYLIEKAWPWLGTTATDSVTSWMVGIFHRFDSQVAKGKETLESFIDWVASIEPPETCSECHSEQPVNEIQVCQECQP